MTVFSNRGFRNSNKGYLRSERSEALLGEVCMEKRSGQTQQGDHVETIKRDTSEE